MKSSRWRIQASHGQWFTLLALVVPACWYTFSYVPNQQAYFAHRNFRLLSVTGDELKSRIDNSIKTLENQTSTAKLYNNPDWAVRWIQTNISLVPGLELTQRPVVTNVNSGEALRAPEVRLSFDPDLGLRFDCTAIVEGYGHTNYVSLKAKREFPNVIGKREEFDAMLLAEENGTVLFQRASAGWKILQLNELSSEAGVTLKSNLTRGASSVGEVTCAGHRYRVFLHPIRILPATTNSPAVNFWVCGLVQSKRFMVESLAISHRSLVRFIFLALAVAVAMPWLKLRLMGPHTPLRPRDAVVTCAATAFASGLIACFLLDAFCYKRTETKLNGELETLAATIATNFVTEITDISEQLKLLNSLPEKVTTNMEERLPETGGYVPSLLDKIEVMSDLRTAPYPFFDMVLWIKPDGWQVRKWTIQPAPTPFINVKARPYFADAHARSHSLYRCSINHTNLWIQPIISWNSGESSVLVAVPGTNGVVAMDSKLMSLIRPILPSGFGYVVAAPDGQVLLHSDLTRNLQENIVQECDNDPSLRSALLGGRSEPFHVRYRGRLHTFLLNPVPGCAWSLIVFRDAAMLNQANLDTIIVALAIFGLYFVCFGLLCYFLGVVSRKGSAWLWPDPRNNRRYVVLLILNMAFAALISALICYSFDLSFSSLTLTIFSLISAAVAIGTSSHLRKSTLRDGFGQKSNHSWQYVGFVASLLLLIGVVPAIGFFKLAHDSQVILMIKEGQLRLTKALQARANRIENDYRSIITIPERRNQLLERRLNGRKYHNEPLDLYLSCFFETEWQGLVQKSSLPSGSEATRSPAANELNASSSLASRWKSAGAFLSRWFENLLGTLRPFHHRTSGPTHAAFTENVVDKSWEWRIEPGTPGRLHLSNRTNPQLRLVSELPSFRLRNDLPVVGLFALILVMVGCMARFIARNIFAVSLEVRVPPVVEPTSTGQSRLILIPSHRTPSHPWLDDPKALHLDLRRPEDWKPWLEKSSGDDINDPRETILIIHSLEYKYDEPEFNRVKLKLFEKLLADNRRTMAAVSAVDPSSFRFGPVESTPLDENAIKAAQSDRKRWLEIFESFVRDYENAGPAHQLTEFSEAPSAGRSATPNTEYRYIQNYTHHRSLWATCSRAEQHALHQVARHGFINPRNPELPSLMDRGLIVRKPNLQVFDNSFRLFVLAEFRPDSLSAGTQDESINAWNDLKKPLWVLLIAFALFFFLTQRELFSATMTIIAGFTAGIPALLKFLNVFDKEKAKTVG